MSPISRTLNSRWAAAMVALSASAILFSTGCPQAAGDEAPPSSFKGFARVEKNLDVVSMFSSDKQAATLLFSNFVTTIDGSGRELVATRIHTFVIPVVADPMKSTRIGLQIRGFVATIGKTRAALVIQAGGKTRVVDLEEAIIMAQRDLVIQQLYASSPSAAPAASGASIARRAEVRASSKSELSEATAKSLFDDFFVDLAFAVPPEGKNPITITVLVERDDESTDNQGFLAIDSIDIEVTDPKILPPAPASQ